MRILTLIQKFHFRGDEMINTWLRQRIVRKAKGIPILQIIYKPQNPAPNLMTYHIHPELLDDELNDLLKQVAEKVRMFYKKHPELIAEVFKELEK